MTFRSLYPQASTKRDHLFRLGEASLPSLPTINATTVLFDNAQAFLPISQVSLCLGADAGDETFQYGGVGTPTTFALSNSIARLEGGKRALLAPSGQAAIAVALLALLKSGDRLLTTDATTYTTKWLFDRELTARGIKVDYCAAGLGAAIVQHITPDTRAVFVESPGSLTFEVEDLPAISAACRKYGSLLIVDSTWSGSILSQAIALGADACILSLTKYHAGSSGLSLGALVTSNEVIACKFRDEAALLGMYVSPGVCAGISDQMATLNVRLRHQERTTQAVLSALSSIEAVHQVYHPSLPSHPNFNIWQRDFQGSNSLVSVGMGDISYERRDMLLNRFQVFRLGHGWGGAISLVAPFDASEWRTVSPLPAAGTYLRLYIGLEDATELVADINHAFSAPCA